MKDHEEPLHTLDFVPSFDDILIDFEEGTAREIELHDGSRLVLKKLSRDYDPTDRMAAITALHESDAARQVLTGILYHDRESQTLTETLNLVDQPLATLPEEKVRPSRAALEKVMEEFR
jgi:2-oxoglutarate ferredoxin oxidoreductase subunit beta